MKYTHCITSAAGKEVTPTTFAYYTSLKEAEEAAARLFTNNKGNSFVGVFKLVKYTEPAVPVVNFVEVK